MTGDLSKPVYCYLFLHFLFGNKRETSKLVHFFHFLQFFLWRNHRGNDRRLVKTGILLSFSALSLWKQKRNLKTCTLFSFSTVFFFWGTTEEMTRHLSKPVYCYLWTTVKKNNNKKQQQKQQNLYTAILWQSFSWGKQLWKQWMHAKWKHVRWHAHMDKYEVRLLGLRWLHNQGRSGDEWSHLLQFLLAAIESGGQGSADRPHICSCKFVKRASL